MEETLSKTVITATGLPQNLIEKEFNSLLSKYGKNPETLTLDELREMMAEYLQIVFLEIKKEAGV